MNDFSDDYDFSPSNSANLQLLSSSDLSETPSLIYTAPKQPKKVEQVKIETSVLSTAVVQVWKLVAGKYTPLGKHGFAVIGSCAQNSYEAILYKEKNNVIMRVKLNPDLEITLKKDNFASFFDKVDHWLIKFNDKTTCSQLASVLEKYGTKIIPFIESTEEVKETEDSNVKTDILARIAKMGQSILPNKENELEASNNSDSCSEKVVTSTPTMSPMNVVQIAKPIQAIPSNYNFAPSVSYDPLSVYVAETRTSSSEIRMNITQMSDKLNSIMQVLEKTSNKNDNDSEEYKRKMKVLELRNENVCRELENLQRENQLLKSKIKEDEGAISVEKHQFELSILKEEENSKREELEDKLNAYKVDIDELCKVIESQKLEIEQSKKNTDEEVAKLNSAIVDLQAQSFNLQQPDKEKIGKFPTVLKEEMNELYARIVDNIGENNSETLNIIAKNIKITTKKILQTFQQLQ